MFRYPAKTACEARIFTPSGAKPPQNVPRSRSCGVVRASRSLNDPYGTISACFVVSSTPSLCQGRNVRVASFVSIWHDSYRLERQPPLCLTCNMRGKGLVTTLAISKSTFRFAPLFVGTRVNAQTGLSPLHSAVLLNLISSTQKLAFKGASINAVDRVSLMSRDPSSQQTSQTPSNKNVAPAPVVSCYVRSVVSRVTRQRSRGVHGSKNFAAVACAFAAKHGWISYTCTSVASVERMKFVLLTP